MLPTYNYSAIPLKDTPEMRTSWPGFQISASALIYGRGTPVVRPVLHSTVPFHRSSPYTYIAELIHMASLILNLRSSPLVSYCQPLTFQESICSYSCLATYTCVHAVICQPLSIARCDDGLLHVAATPGSGLLRQYSSHPDVRYDETSCECRDGFCINMMSNYNFQFGY